MLPPIARILRFPHFLTFATALSLAAPVTADLPDDLSAAEDPRANLQRLIEAITRARTTDAVPVSNLRDVVDNIDAASDRVRIIRSLRSLLPEVTRLHALRERTGQARQPAGFARRFDARSAPPQQPVSAGLSWLTSTTTFDPKTDIWLQVWSDDGEQDDEDGFDGFDASSRGFNVGLDYTLSERWSFGVSVGTQTGDVESAQFGADDLESDDYSVGLAYSRGPHTFDASVTRSANETDRQRRVVINTDAGRREFTLRSNFDTTQTAISLGYSGFLSNGNLAFVPFLSTTWGRLETDDYVESGGGSLNLFVQTEDETQWIGALGGSLSWAHFTDNWLISPNVTVAFEHDFKSEATTALSRFRDTAFSFRTIGYAIEENRWRYSLGLQFLHTSGFSLGLAYDGQRKSNYSYDAAIINLQLEI